jgi:bifunctional DNA-binding transcriptional regulator/antitoxin component of YhaV-PrlF toxin-antitoxin module
MRGVEGIVEYLVSTSGQMSLPADVRRRWKLQKGGPVDVIDLGDAVMIVPGGKGRHLLNDVLSADEHAAFVASLPPDDDLATT